MVELAVEARESKKVFLPSQSLIKFLWNTQKLLLYVWTHYHCLRQRQII